MIKKLNDLLKLFPNMISITVSEKDYDAYRSELMGPDLSCNCVELRFKTLTIQKAK